MVSTAKGCEGLDLENGQGILIEDHPSAMAAAVVRLLKDADYRAALGRAAHEICVERFSWDHIVRQAQVPYIRN